MNEEFLKVQSVGDKKKVRRPSPKREAAIQARKEELGKQRVERYCQLYYNDLLTLEEVSKLMDCSWVTAQETLRSTYFDIATPNKDEERKDMEFRYAELYRKMHGE